MTRYNKFAFLIIFGLAVLLVVKLWSDDKNGIAISGQPYQATLIENIAKPILVNSDIYFGLRNNEAVRSLQQFLANNNFYNGPITGNFFNLTLVAVKKFQVANSINPPLGYVGSKTRAAINKVAAPVVVQPTPIELPKIINKPEVKPEALKSSLKILVTYPSLSLSKYNDVILYEFKLVDEPNNSKIAITRILFKNVGTLAQGYLVNLQLLNSNTGVALASAQEKINGSVEFIMPPNLVVSGGTYSIKATLITPNAGVRPYLQFNIESADDITAVDFNDSTRAATLNEIAFPVVGPKITLP